MGSAGIKYSDPLRSMWDRFRKWSVRMHSQDDGAFCNMICQYAMTFPSIEAQQAIKIQLNFWHIDYQGKLLHVWFEQKKLYDFLQNDVELKELSGIKQYLAANGNHLKEQDLNDPSKAYDFVRYDIALHVPNVEEGFAFSFCLLFDNTVELFFVDDEGVGRINESDYNNAKYRGDDEALSIERDFRLAVNLLAYMECFPECVRNGVPSTNNETVYHYNGRNIRLSISEKVLNEGQKGVRRPHMRKGYFKCLTSSFYKNKRGQIIFVRETMVKGKSKTVDLSDDKQKVDEFKNT